MKILLRVSKQVEIHEAVISAEMHWIRDDDGHFRIIVIGQPPTSIFIDYVAINPAYAYRQFMLLQAMPILTETLASDAMAIVFAQSLNAELVNSEVDPNAVRQAVGSEEFDRILALPLPEDIAAQLL